MSLPGPADPRQLLLLQNFGGIQSTVGTTSSGTTSLVASASPDSYPDVSYVACHVSRSQQRTQQHQPRAWGLWISFVDDDQQQQDSSLLVVGAVDEPTFFPLVKWRRITSNQPDLRVLTNRSYGIDLWKTYFAMLPPPPGPTHHHPHGDTTTLMAKDIILSINGIPVSSGFQGDLKAVLDYLHGCDEIFLVAVRDIPPPPPQQELHIQLQQQLQPEKSKSSYVPPHITPLTSHDPSGGGMFANHHQLWDPTYHPHYHHHHHHHHPYYYPPYPDSGAAPFAHPCHARPQPSSEEQQQLLRVVTPPKPVSNTNTASGSSQHQHRHHQIQLVHSYKAASTKPSITTNAKRSLQMNTFGSNNDINSHENRHHQSKTPTTNPPKITSLAVPMEWTNPMFEKRDGQDKKVENEKTENLPLSSSSTRTTTTTRPLPYCANYTFDPYDGTRSSEFLFPVNNDNFEAWLTHRKWKWRSKWNITSSSTSSTSHPHRICYDDNEKFLLEDSVTNQERTWTNSMFMFPNKQKEDSENTGHKEEKNHEDHKSSKPADDVDSQDIKFLPYDDNYDAHHHQLAQDEENEFLTTINSSNWSSWLARRKQNWRTKWKPYELETDTNSNDCEEQQHQNAMSERLESTVRYDFWKERYSSFDGWLEESKNNWKKSYSWNSRKRKRIQQVCEQVVQFPSLSLQQQDPVVAQQQVQSWLRVRKNQWRMLRRKRQRRLDEEAAAADVKTNGSGSSDDDATAGAATTPITPVTCGGGQPSEKQATVVAVSGDYRHIDALLEEEEEQKKTLAEQKKCRQPLDLSFLFLPSLGMSDDIAAHIVEFLDTSEHGKLLCINKSFADGLQSRAYMWQLLCNRCPHWHFPRRPRKPWHKLYFSKVFESAIARKKQWDDLLTNVADVLFKADHVKKVKQLIEKAIKKFSFNVNYVSGVVCERNSILNLAVIHKRHKVVKWLLEEKNADIESSDRGHFTPLINAAWGGDKHMVRFLLSHGANRCQIGTGHYTEALAPSDFEGLTAEGWARKKRHNDIAELIRVGL